MNKTYLLSLLFLVNCKIFCQTIEPEVLASTGGSGSNSGSSICWTAGEAVIHELTDGFLVLSQGFHQGDLAVVSGVENLPLQGQINAFPNPVKDNLTIELLDIPSPDKWSVTLYSQDGKIILREEINSGLHILDCSQISAGSYLMRITDNQDHYKTFNIIKQ
jgi:hypothetical protein